MNAHYIDMILKAGIRTLYNESSLWEYQDSLISYMDGIDF